MLTLEMCAADGVVLAVYQLPDSAIPSESHPATEMTLRAQAIESGEPAYYRILDAEGNLRYRFPVEPGSITGDGGGSRLEWGMRATLHVTLTRT